MATTWTRCPRCGERRSIPKVDGERMCRPCAQAAVKREPKGEVRK